MPVDFPVHVSFGARLKRQDYRHPGRIRKTDLSLTLLRMTETPYRLSDFDFDLPAELIAQFPAEQRTASRLLHVAPDGAFTDLHFTGLRSLLHAGDLLVMNDTRVLKARLFGAKPSGGKVELLIERVIGARSAMAQIRASHAPAIASRIVFTGPDNFAAGARVVDRDGRFFLLDFDCDVHGLMNAVGHLPLPPYIRHADQAEDAERYQTVYAQHAGAVAAPTAGLHFDAAMLDTLRSDGVATATLTLHVGAGTFLPVQTENLAEHRMHREWYTVSPELVDAVNATRASGGRVVCVGTTSLRALEAASASGELRAGSGETDIFITPGYHFHSVDMLLTNFHLPRSTLLMLVSAFAGYDTIRAAYAHAIAQRYRFFSYGDAMLLTLNPAAHFTA
jgi:S-adenosylmethionine:tRNA ribosyltransferase-isomerase